MNKTGEMIVLANSAVEEAERCRLEALVLLCYKLCTFISIFLVLALVLPYV